MAGSITVKNTVIGGGVPLICVPLTSGDPQQSMEGARAAVAAGADLVEWRADLFEGIFDRKKVREMLEGLCHILGETPLIFTVRTGKEGGDLQISPGEYVDILKDAAATGLPALVDVEVLQLEGLQQKELAAQIHQAGGVMIGSSHHFHRTPSEEEMEEIFRREDQAGADILKLAVMPHDHTDVASLLDVTGRMAHGGCQKPVITMSMGEMGDISRICGEIFGSAVTFAAMGKASAPGQLPIEELRRLLQVFHRFR